MNSDTIVALATAPYTAAIGVIRLSGPKAFDIVNRIYDAKDLHSVPSHSLHFGQLKHDDQIIDEVLLSVFKAPNSYTGEDIVEISAHGSPYILNQIIEIVISHGARNATAGEFTLRAFLNKKMDLSQAEAVADLIASESKASHVLAMNQLKGGVKNEIQSMRTDLLNFASLIELELDFGEEDVEFADRTNLSFLVNKILISIKKLLESFQLGNAIHEGVSTVIAGRPNAGKSTLLNALLNDERAIVSAIPGTTRDTIEERLIIDGVIFKLVDTAGIREATDQIEAIGIERTMKKIQDSAILIYVVDVSTASKSEVEEDLAKLHSQNMNTILLLNKWDVNTAINPQDFQNQFVLSDDIIPCSAKENININLIKNKLISTVTKDQKLTDRTIISNARHFEALHHAAESLESVIQGIHQNIETDFLAQHIRHALFHLGVISGEITNDEILGNIFSKFCIGK